MGKIALLLSRLAGQRVYLDTNVFIYFLDRHPNFFAPVAAVIEAAEAGRIIAYTGDAAVAETLVKPYQSNNVALIVGIKEFFATEGMLSIVPHDTSTFDLAAQFRGKQGMKFIDALHYATALKRGCKFLITNDIGFKSSDSVEVVLLKDFID